MFESKKAGEARVDSLVVLILSGFLVITLLFIVLAGVIVSASALLVVGTVLVVGIAEAIALRWFLSYL